VAGEPGRLLERPRRSALTPRVLFLWYQPQGLRQLRRLARSSLPIPCHFRDLRVVLDDAEHWSRVGGLRLIPNRSSRSPTLKCGALIRGEGCCSGSRFSCDAGITMRSRHAQVDARPLPRSGEARS
jgi:hypothetical protein